MWDFSNPPLHHKIACWVLLTTFFLTGGGLISTAHATPADSTDSKLFAPNPGLSVALVDTTDAETTNSTSAFDRPEDPWFGQDKFLHASISFLNTVTAQYALENKLGLPKTSALPISMLAASLVGVGKELYDFFLSPSQYFSERDLLANTVGVASAGIFIML